MDKFRKLVGKYSLKLIQTKYTKYYMVLVLAMVWMLFLDRFKLTSRYKVQQEIEQLRTERNYYEQSLKELEKRSYQMTQSEEIERLAREKYYMKKSDEDVFLIVEEWFTQIAWFWKIQVAILRPVFFYIIDSSWNE